MLTVTTISSTSQPRITGQANVGSNGAFDLASSAESPFAIWCSIQAGRHCPRVLMSCSIFLPARLVAPSVVTNLARPDRAVDDIATEGEAVCRAAATAADDIWAIIQQLLRERTPV